VSIGPREDRGGTAGKVGEDSSSEEIGDYSLEPAARSAAGFPILRTVENRTSQFSSFRARRIGYETLLKLHRRRVA
jgi:hypothetical protein